MECLFDTATGMCECIMFVMTRCVSESGFSQTCAELLGTVR